MIHKLFFIGGPVFLVMAVILYHCPGHIMMNCRHFNKHHRLISGFMTRRISRKLKLDKNQESRLLTVRDDLLLLYDEMQAAHAILFQALIEEAAKDNVDQERINDLFRQKTQHPVTVRPLIIQKAAEFHASLNSGQKNRLIGLLRKHYTFLHK